MKKYVSMVLSIAMMLTLVLPVNAETINTTDSQDVLVTYGVSQGFLVTIPTDFDISTQSKSAIAEVSATNVMIGANSILEVSVSGHDYTTKWELIDETESSNKLTYTIGSTAGGTDIVNNSVVLSVNPGEAYNSTKTEIIHFTVVDDLTKSGTYKDVLTFNVEISGEDPNHQGLYFNQPYKGVYSDPNNYLEAEITVDEAGNAKAWVGMVENEYAMYMEMPITFTNEEVFDPDGSLIGEILNNGKTVNFFFNDEVTIEMNLSKAVTPTAPLPGTYVNSLENAYITLDENGVVNGYINDELYGTGSINDGIVHPSGKHIAALPVGNGMWYAFSSTSIQPEYLFTVDIPQTLAAEDRIDKYSLMYDATDGIGDDGAEGFANMAIIMVAAGTEIYKLSDEVLTEDFIESMNVKILDFVCGKTFYNVALEKGYSNTYDFPTKDTLPFENTEDIPNLYMASVAEPLGKNYLTVKSTNNIVTYSFEEENVPEDENGVFFKLIVVPEAGYYSEGNIYYLEPGVYIHSYSQEYNNPHNFRILFSK